MTELGESIPRVDASTKVTGEALYPGDYNFSDQLYMKILFSQKPHAIIKSIDTREAEEVDGVVAIFTAKDVPVNIYGLIIPDQPVLCGPGSNVPGADRVRNVGDQIALIVAQTEQIATKAMKLIKVDYEDLPILTDPLDAMKDGAYLIHPERGTSNIFIHDPIRKGNIEEGFEQADVIVESDYSTPNQEHAYLQPEAGVSYIDDEGRVTVVVGGQWAHEDQEQIAHSLNIPLDKVRVIYPAIGGAFGGREDMSIQIVLALAAWKLHQRGIDQPVKIIWSREESIIGHAKRHKYHIHSKWGATKDGKVVAAEVKLVADGGAYVYTSTKVLGNAVLACTGTYKIPNVKVDGYAVYTNNLPGAAFRGFGAPQGVFSAEMQMDKLAEKLGMDPVEIRMRNLLTDGSITSMGSPLPKGVSLPAVVEKCAIASGWKNDSSSWKRTKPIKSSEGNGHLKRGIGIACAFKNIGFSYGALEECWATVELYGNGEIEKVIVRHAAAEVGQGVHTVLSQIASKGLNVDAEKIELILSDTAKTKNSGSVSASRMTFMAGNAMKGAIEMALKKWKDEERPSIATYCYVAPKTTPLDPVTGQCYPNFAYGYVAETVELEVDIETGLIRLLRVICADDVGKAVNMQLVEGQIEGAIVQSAGYSLLENFIQKDGYVVTPTLSTYLIPTVLDIPDHVESIVLEYPDPNGAWGIRGMGEMPLIPLPAAINAALYDATGVWFDDFPLTPERVLRGLGKLQS